MLGSTPPPTSLFVATSAKLPLVEELIPAPDPWEIAQRLSGLPHLLFLDSADRERPSEFNRYSYVAADPIRWLSGRTDEPNMPTFDDLAKILAECELDALPDMPPYQGGIAGLFGYDVAHAFEKLPRAKKPATGPDLAIGVYDWVISWDHQTNRAWIVSTGCGNNQNAQQRISQVRKWLDAPPPMLNRYWPLFNVFFSTYRLPDTVVGSNFTPEGFCAAVRRAVEFIHAGDCFQINLAQQLWYAKPDNPFQLYDRLRSRNAAPYSAFLNVSNGEWFQQDGQPSPPSYGHLILSASPEQFLRVNADGQVTTRPIKGTRPRSTDSIQDARNLSELLASEKDRAENVMIVDLLRNDLGKVCEYGSIQVTRVCEPEMFRTVHHLVSEVVGKLRKGKTALDLLSGAFPGGSVTGAPKIRAMQIIAELEPHARGAYCGSLGYLGFNGTMDTSVLIRTMTWTSDFAYFPVGAGIVADSDPAAEYEETLAKAEGMIRALEP